MTLRELSQELLYRAFEGFGALVLWTPWPVKRAFSRVGGRALYRILGRRRRVILHNLVRAFPRAESEPMADYAARLEAIGRGHCANILLVLLEIFERFHWSDEVVRRKVRVVGREHLEAAERGGGYFLLTAHIGNWELISRVVVSLGGRLAIITKYLRNRYFDDLWKRSRRRYGLDLLEESGSGLGVLRALKAGQCVGFILDQYTGPPHGIEADFFGVRTWCPKGLAILNARAKVPILPMYLIRTEAGSYEFHLGAALQLPEDTRAHVEACNRLIEDWAHRYPEQFLWLHRRFKGAVDYSAPLPWEGEV